mmetsp:Transcript_2697/g.4402  ORF Transcript_2697/g.4402 Transcript_2697/m.4402 type:complete len:115 (-) Transcript_2697:454-798(-)
MPAFNSSAVLHGCSLAGLSADVVACGRMEEVGSVVGGMDELGAAIVGDGCTRLLESVRYHTSNTWYQKGLEAMGGKVYANIRKVRDKIDPKSWSRGPGNETLQMVVCSLHIDQQ